jgi:hypothetical protein
MSGRLTYWVAEGGGRLRSLRLTVCAEEDRGGVPAVRRRRLLRLLREAAHQGGRLSYRDLSVIMLTSKATLKRDMSYLRRMGHELPLRRQ